MKISGWGNYPVVEANICETDQISNLSQCLLENSSILARGLGRSYGDSSLNEQVISTLRLNRFLHFDSKKGRLKTESGVSLKEILEVFIPKGWFLPTTPGTKFITLGGAIAADVHGKNHHKDGTFTNYISEIELLLPNGETKICSRDLNPSLFNATCSGNGLTGIILNATLQLKPIETVYINQITLKAKNIDHIMDIFEEYEGTTYSVAWIDCLATGEQMGRSIFTAGEHATKDDLLLAKIAGDPLITNNGFRLGVPFYLPTYALNKYSIKGFNAALYYKNMQDKAYAVIPYDPFFYPLDFITDWNKIYGKRGFTQYQFVLPKQSGRNGFKSILKKIIDKGLGSFLAVLKLCGEENQNYLSFPMKGYSLALDFPISRELFPFLKVLDRMVTDLGGRIYLTKDVSTTPDTFELNYPKLSQFLNVKQKYDPQHKFQSLQARRMGWV
jgi:decaprenylphospho-beta-D-ribofuranose 2-oxidase